VAIVTSAMSPDETRERKAVYLTVWRWHFYAGLYVVPFFVMLSLTGLVMLARGPVERWQLGDLVTPADRGVPATHEARLQAARAARPGATFVRYEPGPASLDITRVIVDIDARPHTIFVDPVTTRVRGVIDQRWTLHQIADTMHGTLFVGVPGDRLIEIAAGLGVMLLVSGLYLWFPGLASLWSSLAIRRHPRRLVWRDVHTLTGVLLAPVLLFYLVSGLAWAGVWGEWFVQAWNTYPAELAAPQGGEHVHGELNAGGAKVVPWNLEQTPLPQSAAAGHVHEQTPLPLDTIVAVARTAGIGDQFWAGVPAGVNGVWTVAQTAMAANIIDPREEMTVHIDRYTGAILGVVTWDDYGAGAQAMAAGIPLHMGYLGWWNYAGAVGVCLAVLGLSATGVAMWWLRRPNRAGRLVAPPAAPITRVPPLTWATLVVLAVGMPLFGATLVGIAVVDRVVLRRFPALLERLS
jgi:uncharacterized iron-regulated membrane protein